MWVSTNKAKVYVLDANELTLLNKDKEIKLNNPNPAEMGAASADGQLVAIGDNKGYITVFNTATMEQAFYTAYHNKKILYIAFTQDNLISFGFD